jgi:hypothetical protein
MRLTLWFLLLWLGVCVNAFAQNYFGSVGFSLGVASAIQNSSVATPKKSFAFGLNLDVYALDPWGFGIMIFSSRPSETVRSTSGLISFNYRLSRLHFSTMLGHQILYDDSAKVESIDLEGDPIYEDIGSGFHYGLGMSHDFYTSVPIDYKTDLAVSPGVYYLRGIGPAFHQLYFLVEFKFLERKKEMPVQNE